MSMAWIATYFAVGVAFGLATFRIRHLLSEGPSTPPDDEPQGAGALALWLCIASTLWPVLALSGVYGAWRRRGRPAR